MITDPLTVFLFLVLVTWVSIALERHVRGFRSVGSVLTAILLAAVASNIGLLPAASPMYDQLGGIGVSLGIALVLIGIDVRTLSKAGPALLKAFAIGVVGTAVGAVVGGLLFVDAIGPETWKLAGQYTGTYTGGSVNFVAIGRGVETSPALYAAAIAADAVTTTVWMAACFVLPAALTRFWPVVSRATVTRTLGVDEEAVTFVRSRRAIAMSDVSAIALVVLAAVWASDGLGRLLPGVPAVLWLTTIALVLGQLRPIRRLSGAPLLGNYALHLFLATIGAQSVLSEITRVGPAIFYFTLIVVGVHGVVVFGVGRMMGIDLPTLAVASQANVGGPASAMALATSQGYTDKVLPGVAIGLLGYAVGTYTGFGVAAIVRPLLGG